MAIGDQGTLLTVDIDTVRLEAVGALPEHRVSLVSDQPVVVGGGHRAGDGLQGLVSREHRGIGLLLRLIRQTAGVNMPFGGEVTAALVEADVVGRGGLGAVPHAGVVFERDEVFHLLQDGAVGLGLAVPFLVGEISPLFHARHLAGLGIEGRRSILAHRDCLGPLPGALFGCRIALCAAIHGAERLDAVLRAVRDPHVVAGESAMPLARAIGQELQRAGSVRLQVVEFAPAGPHLYLNDLAPQDTRLGQVAN